MKIIVVKDGPQKQHKKKIKSKRQLRREKWLATKASVRRVFTLIGALAVFLLFAGVLSAIAAIVAGLGG